ncbi:MAG: PQQ-binding-like beta-propeller repeat protein [Myxococcales bacterium]|nr:PQQ-binding-like beta-propeller repeat protein [Myxococcales bacterium]
MGWLSLVSWLWLQALGAPDCGKPAASTISVAARIPAADARVFKDTLFVLEPDYLHVAAFDARSGKLRWRSRFQEKAAGFHSLHLASDRVFVYAGNRIVALEAAGGKLVVSRTVPWHEDRRNRSGCTLDVRLGACALDCQCSFQFLSCRDLTPIGPTYRATETCFEPMDDLDEGGCSCGPGAWLLGRAGELLLACIEDAASRETSAFSGQRAVIAVDRRTSREVYRSAALGVSSWWREGSGVSPDGEVCWLRGGKGDGLRIFSCQTGALLSHRKDCEEYSHPVDAPAPSGEAEAPSARRAGTTLEAVAGASELSVRERAGGRELARFEGVFSILAVEGALGEGWLMIYRHEKDAPGQVFRIGPAR